MNSSERRMKIILMLQQSKKRLTVDKLAKQFGVSRRTIFRDFNALSKMNVPVTWDSYSGYGVVSRYKIPPLMFNSRELATILVGLNFVKSQVDETLANDAKGVELKIREVLPDKLVKFMDSLKERTVVDPFMNFGAEKTEGGNWYLVSSAISQNKKMRFCYRSKSKEKVSQRKIDPYLLVFYHDHWNVIGWSEKRADFRNFVMTRISDIEILDEKFTPDDNIDVEALIFRSDEKSHLIEVEVASAAVRQFKGNLPTKIFKEKEINPNLFRLSFYFDNLDYINKWLLQFSVDIKVIKPEILIEKRVEILKCLLTNT